MEENKIKYKLSSCGRGCSIRRLLLCRGERPHSHNKCPVTQVVEAVEYTDCFSAEG